MRRKKTRKTRAEIKEIEKQENNRKKNNEIRSQFFRKISKINKPMTKLTKIKIRKPQVTSEMKQGISLQTLQASKG